MQPAVPSRSQGPSSVLETLAFSYSRICTPVVTSGALFWLGLCCVVAAIVKSNTNSARGCLYSGGVSVWVDLSLFIRLLGGGEIMGRVCVVFASFLWWHCVVDDCCVVDNNQQRTLLQ